MTKRESEILQLIKTNPLLSQNAMALKLGITRSSVAVHLSNLMKKGLIKGKGYIIDENPYKSLENKARTMLLGIQKLMFSAGIPFSTNQIGGMFGFFFLESLPQNIQDVSKSNDKMFCSFLNAAISNGIYFAPSKFEAGFISYKHGDKEIDKTLEIVEKIIKNKGIKK